MTTCLKSMTLMETELVNATNVLNCRQVIQKMMITSKLRGKDYNVTTLLQMRNFRNWTWQKNWWKLFTLRICVIPGLLRLWKNWITLRRCQKKKTKPLTMTKYRTQMSPFKSWFSNRRSRSTQKMSYTRKVCQQLHIMLTGIFLLFKGSHLNGKKVKNLVI